MCNYSRHVGGGWALERGGGAGAGQLFFELGLDSFLGVENNLAS